MLVAMTINHLDTELRVFTDYTFGFVSTAEGFVFLSGLVAGLVYGRRSARLSPADLRHQAWRRAGQIYACHLISLLAALLGFQLLLHAGHFVTSPAPALFYHRPLTALVLGGTFLFQPGLFDILPMYCGFMLALPLVISALQQGHWRRLLALSGGLWLLAQSDIHGQLEHQLQTFLPANLGLFDPLAWQLLFVAGASFGFYRATSTQLLLSFRPAMLAICLTLAVPLWWLIKYQHLPTGLTMDLLWSWAEKTHLGPLRLVSFIVVAYLISAVATFHPRFFTLRPMAFLGRNSLIVFSAQALMCALVLAHPGLFATFASRTTIALTMLALLFLVAWLNEVATRRPMLQRSDPAARATPPPPPWIQVRPAASVVNHAIPWHPPASAWRSKSASSSRSTA